MHLVSKVTLWSVLALQCNSGSAATGEFKTMTYNVAGLLELVSSAESPRQEATEIISCYVNDYDIVNVQEDFNYHAALYDTCNEHDYRSPTTGGMGVGSGLNTMSYFAFNPIERIGWNDCNGVDCLTPKGLTIAQVRLAEGVYLDVYNVHAQAESTAEAIAVRTLNMQQIVDTVEARSSGNAVIVMGDFNTRYTRDDGQDLLIDAGFTDVWVDTVRGGSFPSGGALVCDPKITSANCEIVDKVLYRGNSLVTLTPSNYQVRQDDVNEAGQKLSDHPPVSVEWAYTTSSAVRTTDIVGGYGGTSFNDVNSVATTNAIRVLRLRGGGRVDQLSVELDSGLVLAHGGTGGSEVSLTLATNEHVSSAEFCIGERNGGDRVFYARFTTSSSRSIAVGATTNTCTTFTAPSGWKVHGFHGRAGSELDSVGVIYSEI